MVLSNLGMHRTGVLTSFVALGGSTRGEMLNRVRIVHCVLTCPSRRELKHQHSKLNVHFNTLLCS
jgi:hypothetical protein